MSGVLIKDGKRRCVASAFFFSSRRRHTRCSRDWSSDVCSSDLLSPEPLGDYCTGANHVLPTNGYARSSSGLSVRDFLKVITVQELTRAGLRSLGPTAATLAGLEGLDGHALAVTRRLESLAAGAVGEPSATLTEVTS